MTLKLPKLILPLIITSAAATSFLIVSVYYVINLRSQLSSSQTVNAAATAQIATLNAKITDLEKEDQRAKNKALSETINQMKAVYKKSVSVFENLTDLQILSKNTAKFNESFATVISLLASENYSSASAKLAQLDTDIAAEKQKVTAVVVSAPANVPVNNSPPGSGYARQTVTTDAGNFVVSLISADLGSTRVVVDTASDSDCGNACPVLPLATYVSRSGAYAGVNGSYFCPASYPTCAGKTNSFDLLLMNKNKHYFNSDNNVYSNNPGVIFGSGYIRFVTAVSQWGRDTGIDGMLSNYPLIVFNSNVNFGGNDDPKQGSKGSRSFVANRGNTVYIGVVHSATVAESARALKALGMENALNLDDGGSTALWSGGYKVGPGRELPNAILFVRK